MAHTLEYVPALTYYIMSAGLFLGASACGIRTKPDALRYAIDLTTTRDENFNPTPHLDKAKEVFEFFCTNVDLAESESISVSDIIDPVFEKLKEFAESQNKCNCKCKCRDGS